MKHRKFQECLTALRNNDLGVAEALLQQINISAHENAALALASKIKVQLEHKKSSSDSRHNMPGNTSDFEKKVSLDSTVDYLLSSYLHDIQNNEDIQNAFQQNQLSAKQEEYDFLISQRDVAPPLPGVSLVAACMNREENLFKVLDSWLASDVDEIVIVDWSSTTELWPKISQIDDPRIKLIRIDGEKKWVLTHALNVGLRFASHELVVKVDCDILIEKDFLTLNSPQKGEFFRGFWKLGLEECGEGQQYINGTFIAHKKDLRDANYYDERILTYGWDDSDLYMRLSHELGLAGKLINTGTLSHLEQEQEERVANQKVLKNKFLNRFEPTEYEGAKNKYYSILAGTWGHHFPVQDYGANRINDRYFRGSRVTETHTQDAVFLRLAETFAARDLAVWSQIELNGGKEIDLAFAGLLRDAHKLNKSLDLVEGLRSGKGLLFIQCNLGPCRSALEKTLWLLSNHCALSKERLILIEGISEAGGCSEENETVIYTSGPLLKQLARYSRARVVSGVGELESVLSNVDSKSYLLTISLDNLANEAIERANLFSERLGDKYAVISSPMSKTCLVTSLYDEQNLLRLNEYLACVVENLKVFERIIVYYEAGNGLLAAVLYEIMEKLAIQPGRLQLLPYQKRPTFEVLFSAQEFLPEGTTLAVANADIVFDSSMTKIRELDLEANMVVLSRHDVSPDGTKANLIRLQGDLPNTVSSDAWIVATPFKPDFMLDYQIGTMQCDSYINHQISKSSRYAAINPCLDIPIFHLHDERFNSSDEKARFEGELTRQRNAHETARNGGEDPVKGLAWSTLGMAKIVPAKLQLHKWISKVLTLRLASLEEINFGHFVLLHYLLVEVLAEMDDVLICIKLRKKDLGSALGDLFARLQKHHSCSNFLIDFVDNCDGFGEANEDVVSRSFAFNNLVNCITTKSLDDFYSFLLWPEEREVTSLQCEMSGELTTETVLNLLNFLKLRKIQTMNSLVSFFDDLPEYSAEKRMLVPFMVPLLMPADNNKKLRVVAPTRPSVSFVTSLYNGGEFLPGYLENVYAAAVEAGGEVIIIDANEDNHDSLVVNDFIYKNPKASDVIDYVRLDHDPGLYACWQIAIERSRADLITNANIDDRRCPQHTLQLVNILKEHSEYAGACGSISCVKVDGKGSWFAMEENELWFYNEPIKDIDFDDLYIIDDCGAVMSRNVMHCMPVWRKSLHERYGYFIEKSYGTSADWAFWLKCAKAGERFVLEKKSFGRYYLNPDSHNRRNDAEGLKELRIIENFIGVVQIKAIKQ